MKKSWFLLCLLLPLLLFAQGVGQNIPGDPMPEDEYDENEELEYGIGGRLGTVTHNGVSYTQIRLFPQLNIGKFGFGLDIDLLIDAQGKVDKEYWDDLQDYLNKIFFIRWGNRRDPFYFKAGCIPEYTLGHGLIFDHFSNMLRYPSVKNVGSYMGINLPLSGLGFEAYTHNIHKNEILAARVHARPFEYLNVPLVENMKIGVNVGTDRNQYGKYPDSDGDGIPDVYDMFPKDKNSWLDTDGDGTPDDQDFDINGNGIIDHPNDNEHVWNWLGLEPGDDVAELYPHLVFDDDFFQDVAEPLPSKKAVNIYSVDYTLPILENDMLHLDHYAELAIIDGYGNGIIFPGFSASFAFIDAKLEFRNFSDEFIPGYFDRIYDEQRSRVRIVQDGEKSIYSLYGKEELLKSSKAGLGWFGYLRANIANIGYVKMAYQDMYGEQSNMGKSVWANATLSPAVVPKLKEAGLYYSQAYVPYIDFRRPRNSAAALSGKLVWEVSENSNLVARYSETYNDQNGDGIIKGKDEIISSFGMSIEFSF